MYLLIIFLPLISFFTNGLFGRFFGRIYASYLCIICSFLTMLLSIFIYYEIFLLNSIVYIYFYDWINIYVSKITIGFLFDSLTSTMLLIITFISFFVHLYSLGYMSHDPHLNRFLSFLSLFTFFMIILVTADNFLHYF